MFKKKKTRMINDYFNRKIHSILGNLDISLYKAQLKIAEEHNERGVLTSGMTAGAILKMITENIHVSCKEALVLIDLFQKEKNITFTSKQLHTIGETYTQSYNTYFLDKIEKVYFVNVNRYIGEEVAKSIASEVVIRNTSNKINSLVNDEIEDIKIHNQIKRDEPSVVIARKAYRMAFLSIIISVINGIAAIYF